MYQLMLVLALTPIPPAPVTLKYSPVYDQIKHRRYFKECPPLEALKPRIEGIFARWDREKDGIMQRIRRAAELPSFPRESVTVYLASCGRGISDPVTVALYAEAEDGGLKEQSDDEVFTDIVHELLHGAAVSDAHDELWWTIQRFYRDESAVVRNHVLVLAFEARLDGIAKVRERYAKSSDYARALELAVAFGLTTPAPVP